MTILGASVFIYLVAMIPVSFYASRFVKNSKDYVLAGRNLPFYMALATVFATWFGSESILGASSKMAEGGFLNVIEDPFGAGLCLILIGLFFAKKLYSLNHLTIGDYFAERYNKTVAILLSIAITVTYFGWVAAQFVALGIIMQFVFGMSFINGLLVAAGVVVLYTYIGGMWSVVMHDLIQTTIIILGLFAILIEITYKISIHDVIVTTPPEFFNIIPEHTTKDWLAFIAALMTIGLGSIPQQDVYQRAMSAKSADVSKWAAIVGGVLYFTIVLIPIFLGLAARALYPELVAPGADSQLLIPTLIANNTNIFTQVIFYGALLSAIMSTASGALLAPATLLAENIIKPFFPRVSDIRLLRFIKISILVISAGAILLAVKQGNIYELVGGAYSITLVSAFVPLAAGLYLKKANSLGAMFAMLLGALSWQYVEHFTDENFIVPSIIVGFLASITGMLLGIIVERVVLNKKQTTGENISVQMNN